MTKWYQSMVTTLGLNWPNTEAVKPKKLVLFYFGFDSLMKQEENDNFIFSRKIWKT